MRDAKKGYKSNGEISVMFKGFSITTNVSIALVAVVLAMFFIAGQASARPSWADAAKPGPNSIADIATGSNPAEFNTLVTALSCTDLVGAVDGKRQLTVFAPTDAAFEDAGLTPDNVCTDFDKDTLTSILLYHVISGRRNSQSVLAAPSYRTLSGERLTQGELRPVDLDISARNGIVHVIDEVLLPPSVR